MKSYLSAVAEVSATHREIGKLAVHAYINGGGLTDLESILSSSGPQELIDNLSTLENLGVGNKTSLKRFKAAEDIAQRAKAVAEVAKQKQVEVTARVAATKKRLMMQRQNSKKKLINFKLFKTNYNETLHQPRKYALHSSKNANWQS